MSHLLKEIFTWCFYIFIITIVVRSFIINPKEPAGIGYVRIVEDHIPLDSFWRKVTGCDSAQIVPTLGGKLTINFCNDNEYEFEKWKIFENPALSNSKWSNVLFDTIHLDTLIWDYNTNRFRENVKFIVTGDGTSDTIILNKTK